MKRHSKYNSVQHPKMNSDPDRDKVCAYDKCGKSFVSKDYSSRFCCETCRCHWKKRVDFDQHEGPMWAVER